jgi:hypothetical protein
MRAWWPVSLVAVAGCELIFSPSGSGGPPAADANGNGDADDPPDGPLQTPFGAAQQVSIVGYPGMSTFYITDPTLIADESQLVFVQVDSELPDSAQIHVAFTKVTPTMWDAAAVSNVNNPARNDTNPKLTADGLVMWTARAGASEGPADIDAWDRPQANEPSWGDAFELTAGFPTGTDERPGTPIGVERMVITIGNSGASDFAEYVFVTAEWTLVGNDTMTALNSDPMLPDLANAHLTPDGLSLYFVSETTTGNGADLFRATRATIDAPFETAVPLTELNTPAQEGDPWLSHDGRRIWFSRVGGGLPLAQWGIYFAER